MFRRWEELPRTFPIPCARYLTCILLVLLCASSAFFILPASAYVASSTNYRIQEDSINVGGLLSTSTNYRMEDTVGEEGVGTSSSATYNIKAGYQHMHETYLAISVPGNITLSPNIPETGGGIANGAATWTVTTDNPAGFSVTIAASTSPALTSGANSFANYTPGGTDPDFTFSVATTAAEFGFTPEGADIVQRYRDDGATCNTGSGDTASACWDPLLTTATTIVNRATPNHPSGSTTVLRFRAESGSSNTQPPGSYTAVATLTVIAS